MSEFYESTQALTALSSNHQSPLDASLLEAVQVQTTKLEGRQRQISAKLQLAHSVDQIWQILTDYESLAEFIPNLAKSQRLEHPEGGIRLEQIGMQRALKLSFSARVVLDMAEEFPHTIRFQMIEGDFKDFSGAWKLEPLLDSGGPPTLLSYTVRVWPKLTMPIMAIERRLRSDLALNLVAIQQRLQEKFD